MNRSGLSASLEDVIGVVDLKKGRAVHAVAGQRATYRDVPFCRGDADVLLDRYRRCGVAGFYLADLDGITADAPQLGLLQRLLSKYESVPTFIDIGFASIQQWQPVATIAERFQQTHWVVATETNCAPRLLKEVASELNPERIVLGLDYRNGQFINRRYKESQFVDAANAAGIGSVIALDIASVGTGSGPSTIELCRRLRHQLGRVRLISGGGIRSDRDVVRLLSGGCDQVLAATAIFASLRSSDDRS